VRREVTASRRNEMLTADENGIELPETGLCDRRDGREESKRPSRRRDKYSFIHAINGIQASRLSTSFLFVAIYAMKMVGVQKSYLVNRARKGNQLDCDCAWDSQKWHAAKFWKLFLDTKRNRESGVQGFKAGVSLIRAEVRLLREVAPRCLRGTVNNLSEFDRRNILHNDQSLTIVS